ncbi:hypothetical protein ACO2RV_16960 [Ancylobacter sp. VNQ12]|uniref:hypothetical protein n=1 Tax=Ancylobacter sp. VNQ12 TaxID=3400920 RepID=UPI003BFB41AC
MDTLPTPKFAIGDIVFYPSFGTRIEALPCPDCLGTRRWKVVTPAGAELDTECQRCMGWGRPADLPKPERQVAYPIVSRLTVGKIEVTTHPWEGRDPVRYMACETGVGSGSIYDESRLCASEEAAEAVAQAMANAKTIEIAERPEATRDFKLSSLTLKDADLSRTWSERYEAWVCYRVLRDAIGTALEDASLSAKEKIADIAAEYEWGVRNRDPGDEIIIPVVIAKLRQQAPLAECDDVMLADIADDVIDAVMGATGRRAFEAATAALAAAAGPALNEAGV